MLLYGPSGYGKSLLAGLTSRELGLPLVHVSMAELTASDFDFALDMAARDGVLFLDELQAGPRRLRDRLLVVLDPGRSSVPFAIAATTDPGTLSIALRRRFPLEIAECEGPAGLGRLADAVGLDRAHVQGRISMLRKERLSGTAVGKATLTPAAAAYLSQRSFA